MIPIEELVSQLFFTQHYMASCETAFKYIKINFQTQTEPLIHYKKPNTVNHSSLLAVIM